MKYILILWLISQSVLLQAGFVDSNQAWMNLTLQSFSNERKWVGFLEVQPRYGEKPVDYTSVVYRSALGLNLTSQLAFLLGHGFIKNTEPVRFFENRTFVQVNYRLKFLDSSLLRLRVEKRNFSQQKTSYRSRLFLRLQKNYSDQFFSYLVSNHEFFMHHNTSVITESANGTRIKSGIDQNRLFVGFGHFWDEKKKVQFEWGYLNQWLVIPRKDDLMNHGFLANLFVNL